MISSFKVYDEAYLLSRRKWTNFKSQSFLSLYLELTNPTNYVRFSSRRCGLSDPIRKLVHLRRDKGYPEKTDDDRFATGENIETSNTERTLEEMMEVQTFTRGRKVQIKPYPAADVPYGVTPILFIASLQKTSHNAQGTGCPPEFSHGPSGSALFTVLCRIPKVAW